VVTSGFLVAVYIVIIRQLDSVIETKAGFQTTVFETAVLLISLVLFQPVFSWLEGALDNLFLRESGDHRTLLRRMSGEVLHRSRSERASRDRDQHAPRGSSRAHDGDSDHAPGARAGHPGLRRRRGLAAISAIARDALDRLTEDIAIAQQQRDHVPRGRPERSRRDRPAASDAAVPAAPAAPRGTVSGDHRARAEDHRDALTRPRRFPASDVGEPDQRRRQERAPLRRSLAKMVLEEELAVARRIQQQFLPSWPPEASRLGLAAMNLPSKQVGGDYYDLVDLGTGHYLIAIADVAGKGVPAALLASMVQASIRTQAQDGKPVQEMMNRLNRLVHDATPDDRFATCFLANVSGEGREFSFSNAGAQFPDPAAPPRRGPDARGRRDPARDPAGVRLSGGQGRPLERRCVGPSTPTASRTRETAPWRITERTACSGSWTVCPGT